MELGQGCTGGVEGHFNVRSSSIWSVSQELFNLGFTLFLNVACDGI